MCHNDTNFLHRQDYQRLQSLLRRFIGESRDQTKEQNRSAKPKLGLGSGESQSNILGSAGSGFLMRFSNLIDATWTFG